MAGLWLCCSLVANSRILYNLVWIPIFPALRWHMAYTHGIMYVGCGRGRWRWAREGGGRFVHSIQMVGDVVDATRTFRASRRQGEKFSVFVIRLFVAFVAFQGLGTVSRQSCWKKISLLQFLCLTPHSSLHTSHIKCTFRKL